MVEQLTDEEVFLSVWKETGDLTPLVVLADWLDDRDREGAFAAELRAFAAAERGTELAEAARFFYPSGGYRPAAESQAAGYFRGAVRLAKAEAWLQESDYQASWEEDPDYDPGDFDYPGTDDNGEVIEFAWGCVLQCRCPDCGAFDSEYPDPPGRPHHCISLWGITFEGDGYPDGKPYKRVIEAELALELM